MGYFGGTMHSHLLLDVMEGNEFVFSSGRRIKNLKELSEQLSSLPDADFAKHVTNERNDFASWITDCYHDTNLAHAVRREKTRTSMVGVIQQKLEESEQLVHVSRNKKALTHLEYLHTMIKKLENEKHVLLEENTGLRKDLQESAKLIENMQHDFKNIKNLFLNSKKLIDHSFSHTDLDVIIRKIHRAFSFIEQERIDMAEKLYHEILQAYKHFPPRIKKIVYPSCVELHALLVEKSVHAEHIP